MKFDTKILKFNSEGLIPAIAQCSEKKHVLMMAWMNRESIEMTIRTRKVTYYSRSRKSCGLKVKLVEIFSILIIYFQIVITTLFFCWLIK